MAEKQVLRSTRLKDPEVEQELKHILDQIVHKEDTVTKTTSKKRYKITNANILREIDADALTLDTLADFVLTMAQELRDSEILP